MSKKEKSKKGYKSILDAELSITFDGVCSVFTSKTSRGRKQSIIRALPQHKPKVKKVA